MEYDLIGYMLPRAAETGSSPRGERVRGGGGRLVVRRLGTHCHVWTTVPNQDRLSQKYSLICGQIVIPPPDTLVRNSAPLVMLNLLLLISWFQETLV